MRQGRKLVAGVGLIVLIVALYNFIGYRYFGFGWSWQSCTPQGYGLDVVPHTWLRWLLAGSIALLVGVVAWLLWLVRGEAVPQACVACGRALQADWLLCPFCGHERQTARGP